MWHNERNYESYLHTPRVPEVLHNVSQRVTPLHPNDHPKEFPTVWTTEGTVCGVIPQVFQAAHAHAVSTGKLSRIVEDIPTHRARQHFLKPPLHVLHFWRK